MFRGCLYSRNMWRNIFFPPIEKRTNLIDCAVTQTTLFRKNVCRTNLADWRKGIFMVFLPRIPFILSVYKHQLTIPTWSSGNHDSPDFVMITFKQSSLVNIRKLMRSRSRPSMNYMRYLIKLSVAD